MKKFLRFLLPLAVIGAGFAVAFALYASKPKAQKKPKQDQGALVEVLEVARSTHSLSVPAQGTVQAAEQVNLQSEVGGRVLWRSDKLVPGGMVKKGERLVRLDGRDYQLALQQQRAQVDRAQLDLQLERGRKTIAEREWQLLSDKDADAKEGGEGNADLALREPQMRTAKVAVEAAESAMQQAKLNVQRTNLRAPFNAFVKTANADPGQLVNPQATLATLVGTDRFWVQLALPVENLTWIDIPGINASEGSEARVWHDVGEDRIVRTGRVVRLLGDLDPVGRMARVLVEIDDPFNLSEGDERGLPLLVGAFVHVELAGGELKNVFEVPRRALREGDRVYTLSAERKLAIKPIKVVWRGPETVLVKEGLESGDQVIVSRLAAPVEGMLLRLAKSTPAPGSGPQAARQ